ncbi:MAG TPA: hypothetical protein VN699_22260, partial [Pirellulales bacterium]|nr:hypothetical protein [Pirellulales bacterium]
PIAGTICRSFIKTWKLWDGSPMRGNALRLFLAFVVACSLLAAPALARGEVTVADPGTFVVDRAGVIDAPTQQRLENWLKELEQKTTA